MSHELVRTDGPFDEIDRLVWREIYYGSDEDFCQEMHDEWREGYDVYQVTSPEGELLATGSIQAIGCIEADELQIEHVAVAPDARGLGLGSYVLGTLTGIAAENGATKVFLLATDDSVSFYERLGMTQVPTESKHELRFELSLSDQPQ